MLILAIDTALEACAVALLDANAATLRAHETLAMASGHAEALMPLLVQLMQGAGMDFRDYRAMVEDSPVDTRLVEVPELIASYRKLAGSLDERTAEVPKLVTTVQELAAKLDQRTADQAAPLACRRCGGRGNGIRARRWRCR